MCIRVLDSCHKINDVPHQCTVQIWGDLPITSDWVCNGISMLSFRMSHSLNSISPACYPRQVPLQFPVVLVLYYPCCSPWLCGGLTVLVLYYPCCSPWLCGGLTKHEETDKLKTGHSTVLSANTKLQMVKHKSLLIWGIKTLIVNKHLSQLVDLLLNHQHILRGETVKH